MRTILASMTIAVFLAAGMNSSLATQESPEVANAHLTINLSGPATIRSGSSIDIDVALINQTGVVITWPLIRNNRGIDMSNSLDVRGSGGVKPAMTAYGAALTGAGPELESEDARSMVSGRSARLQPGKALDEHVVLTDLYDLRSPDTYVVQAKRYLQDGSVITSNNIEITVVK